METATAKLDDHPESNCEKETDGSDVKVKQSGNEEGHKHEEKVECFEINFKYSFNYESSKYIYI